MEKEPNKAELGANTACYFYHADQVVELPLLAIDYRVFVVNNLARIVLLQHYANPLSDPVELHFNFPIDNDFCFGSLRARFEGYETEGVIMEKKKAKKEYKAEISKGNVAALATISSAEHSVMECRLGNLPPGQSVEIEYEISCELRAESDGQYLLRLPSHIAPRYSRKSCLTALLELFEKLFSERLAQRGFFASFKWNFSIDLETTEPLVSCELVGEPCNTQKISDRHMLLTLAEPVVPLHDISLMFSHEKFNAPQITVSAVGAYVSLAPDHRVEQIEERQMSSFGGEFIFLLDRSGSMCGSKINQAKESLTLFLKSLPDKATFNVVSFGSDHMFMFEGSVPYNDINLTQAIAKISMMGADMGGTEIGAPLRKIESNILKTTKNVNVFVITDGQVSNTEEIIQINRSICQDKGGRVHMVGIGNGISVDMIKRGAQFGGGECVFILNETAMKKQIIGLLMKIVMPRLSMVSLKFDSDVVEEIESNIDGEFINRGSHTHIIAKFVAGVSKEQIANSSITLKYKDEEDGKDYEYHIPLAGSVVFHDDTILKLFVHRRNQRLAQERAPKWKESIIENSIKYQVLSPETAFLCRIKEVSEAKIDQPTLMKLKNYMEGESSMEKSKLITINVKTLTGKSLDITLSNLSSGEDVKEAVQQIEGIPVDQQRMIFAGRQIENDRSLLDMNINDYDTLHLVLRLRGDGGGSSSSSSQITVSAYGTRFTVRPESTVRQVKQRVCSAFQTLRPHKLKVFFESVELIDESKALVDCGITADKREITVQGPKITNANFFVSSMKADGSWDINKEFLQDNDLSKEMETLSSNLKNDRLAYTVLVYVFMRKNLAKDENELRMVYRKIRRFIEESLSKEGIAFNLNEYLAKQP